MSKNIIIGFLIAVCIAIGVWSFRSGHAEAKVYESTIDSVQAVLNDQKIQITTYKKVVIQIDREQAEHISRADSLQKLLDNPKVIHTCPEKVEILEEQVVELRNGLAKCNEAKAIQVTTIGIQDEVISNVETISEIRVIQYKQEKKSKIKAFFAGMGAGAIVVTVLIILL